MRREAVLLELLRRIGRHRDAQVGRELKRRFDVDAVGGLEHRAFRQLRRKLVLHRPFVVLGEVRGHLVDDLVTFAHAFHERVEHAHRAKRGDAVDGRGDLDLAARHVGDGARCRLLRRGGFVAVDDSCDGDEHPARPVHASAADSAMAATGASQLRFLPISSFFMIPPFFPGSCYRSPCATTADGASEGTARATEENPASSSKGMHVFIDSAPTDVWPTCTGVS